MTWESISLGNTACLKFDEGFSSLFKKMFYFDDFFCQFFYKIVAKQKTVWYNKGNPGAEHRK